MGASTFSGMVFRTASHRDISIAYWVPKASVCLHSSGATSGVEIDPSSELETGLWAWTSCSAIMPTYEADTVS